jgi:hypothetical protein
MSPQVQPMVYRGGVTRSQRISLQQPTRLVDAAADAAGFPLSSYLHAWIVSAVRTAEAASRHEADGETSIAAGLDAQLPREAARPGIWADHDAEWTANPPPPRSDGTEQPIRTRIALPVTAADRARWDNSLAARGSSVLACVTEALSALKAADGSWLDADMPGLPAPSWQGVGAA